MSSVPSNLFIYIISACTVIKENSETISYWQSGAYIRNGTVDISVCQWKDKLVLQVLARALISNSTRQAVNKAWSILAKYLYAIEMFLSLFPGLYYEVCMSSYYLVCIHPFQYQLLFKHFTGYLLETQRYHCRYKIDLVYFSSVS